MLAIVFPGQGSQAIGMALDFARSEAAAARVFEEAEAAFGGGLLAWIESGPEAELARTEITQPAILTASIAIYRALEARLPRPAFFAGHSLGEYSALVAAGGLPLGDAVRLVRRRGAFMPPGPICTDRLRMKPPRKPSGHAPKQSSSHSRTRSRPPTRCATPFSPLRRFDGFCVSEAGRKEGGNAGFQGESLHRRR